MFGSAVVDVHPVWQITFMPCRPLFSARAALDIGASDPLLSEKLSLAEFQFLPIASYSSFCRYTITL